MHAATPEEKQEEWSYNVSTGVAKHAFQETLGSEYGVIFSGADADGTGEVTTEDLKLFAKKVAETELKRAQEDRRLSKMITRAVGQGDDLNASLLEQ